jgi:ATP-dependent RNA circularization protein (DNA/RNA ligase family)
VSDFFRFPRTPHLVWLGEGDARRDKILSPEQARELLSGSIVVEEKVDGANLGLSISEAGVVQAQNRGAYLVRETCHAQFRPLFRWLSTHQARLRALLDPSLILFGEWCYAVHSVRYTELPDWFLAFDVYDRRTGRFWSVDRRDGLVDELGLARVPRMAHGHFALADVIAMLGPSRLGTSLAEGLYVRRDEKARLVARAKVVRPEFTQQIEDHWASQALQVNRLSSGAIW